MKKSELAEYIKKIIEQVRVEGHDCAVHDDEGQSHEEWEAEQEDSLEEINTTGNADGYMTPHAFAGDDEDTHKTNIKDKAEVFDYKSTDNEKKNTVTEFSAANTLKESKSLYHRYRDADDMKPRQKIGISIREINRLLGDVEKLVNINSRFKSELNVPSDGYWKRTKKQLAKVDERLVRISRKIRNMR
jgi:hypothetical protein